MPLKSGDALDININLSLRVPLVRDPTGLDDAQLINQRVSEIATKMLSNIIANTAVALMYPSMADVQMERSDALPSGVNLSAESASASATASTGPVPQVEAQAFSPDPTLG